MTVQVTRFVQLMENLAGFSSKNALRLWMFLPQNQLLVVNVRFKLLLEDVSGIQPLGTP